MAKLGATNISIMDVRNILGYPSTDLGTLCTCNNINPWSKWKPIHCANTLTLNNELLKRNKYGIEILEANNPGALVNLIQGISMISLEAALSVLIDWETSVIITITHYYLYQPFIKMETKYILEV